MNSTDIEFDEFCDPNNPRRIKVEEIIAAKRRITGTIIKTPCTKAHMSDKLGVEIFMKQEFLQYTGSFKERGVCNTLMNLTDEEKKAGVITASFGNHGTALSHHATIMGIPCIVVVPVYTSTGIIARCARLGAKVIVHSTSMADAKKYALTISKEKNMMYINGYDHPHVIEGQGTVGLEVIEQVPEFDAILVPTGGGGLLCGVATAIKALKPAVEVYGIETDKTNSMTESLKKNERVFVHIESSICDKLAVNLVGVNTFHSVRGLVDKMICVKEDWVARAMTRVIEQERFIVEGAGCVGIAAILAGLLPNLKGKKVVCIMSGGNIVPADLTHVMERGLTAEGRLFKFRLVINDRPGGLTELCNMLASLGIALRDLVPERSWVKGDICSVEVKVICETKGWEHTKEMIEQIKKNYKQYYFPEMSERPEKAGTRRGPCLAPHPVCMDNTTKK